MFVEWIDGWLEGLINRNLKAPGHRHYCLLAIEENAFGNDRRVENEQLGGIYMMLNNMILFLCGSV